MALVTYTGKVPRHGLICAKYYICVLPYKATELLIFMFYRTCLVNTHVCYTVGLIYL